MAQFMRTTSRLMSRLLVASTTRSIASKSIVNAKQQQAAALCVNLTNLVNKRFYAADAAASKLTKQQVEERVLTILRNFDRVKENPAKPQVTLESHLAKDLGLDSLDHVEIIVQLEDAFGYEIPDSDYEKLYTPNEIVKYIQTRLAEI